MFINKNLTLKSTSSKKTNTQEKSIDRYVFSFPVNQNNHRTKENQFLSMTSNLRVNENSNITSIKLKPFYYLVKFNVEKEIFPKRPIRARKDFYSYSNFNNIMPDINKSQTFDAHTENQSINMISNAKYNDQTLSNSLNTNNKLTKAPFLPAKSEIDSNNDSFQPELKSKFKGIQKLSRIFQSKEYYYKKFSERDEMPLFLFKTEAKTKVLNKTSEATLKALHKGIMHDDPNDICLQDQHRKLLITLKQKINLFRRNEKALFKLEDIVLSDLNDNEKIRKRMEASKMWIRFKKRKVMNLGHLGRVVKGGSFTKPMEGKRAESLTGLSNSRFGQ